MKIGLDIHGVIDAHRPFFAEFSKLLVANGHEVHVMTGPRFKALKPDELKDITYTHFFSIVDHCVENNVEVVYDGDGNPWIDQYEWNKAKGDYARLHKIDLVIDDSVDYPKFFSTPIATFKHGQMKIGDKSV